MGIQDIRFYQLLVKKKFDKLISKLTSEIHLTLLDEYASRTHLAEIRGNIESLLKRGTIAYLLKEYFLEQTSEQEYIDRQCINNILEHANQELGRHSTLNIQLLSALIGAVVAVALMYLGAFLIKLLMP
jgi:hypothetical protein